MAVNPLAPDFWVAGKEAEREEFKRILAIKRTQTRLRQKRAGFLLKRDVWLRFYGEDNAAEQFALRQAVWKRLYELFPDGVGKCPK